MSVYKRFFRVTKGPMVEEIDRLFELRFAASKLYEELRVKYGAKAVHNWQHSGAFAGFVFEKLPDQSIYCRVPKQRGLWRPRKNVPAGKSIWAEIKQLPEPSPIEHALRLVGLEPGLPMLTDAGRWYAPTLWGYGAPRNVWFVSVPWKDEDPQKLEEYKAIKAAKKGFDRDLGALLWEPPSDWVEVKRWEVEKEVDEIKAEEKGSSGEGDFE